MRSTILCMLLCLGCRPLDQGTTTDTDLIDPDAGPTFGRLYSQPMSLVWGWSDQRADGVCVDLKIATNGASVSTWQLDITLDAEVETLQFVSGADVRVDGASMTILPSVEEILGPEDEVLASFCSDPGVRLRSMEATATYVVEEVLVDTDEAPLPYGTMLGPEGTYALEYAQDGSENGGACLRMHVINLIDEPLFDWAIEVTLDGDAAPTYTEGLRFYSADADTLVILPDADSRTIQPFDDEAGIVCLEPLALPIRTRIGAAPVP